MVRYTLLRFLVFFGCLILLWLLGLRDRDEQVYLLLGAAMLSMAISFVLLRPAREDASVQIARKVQQRAQKRSTRVRTDADATAEDAESEGDYR